MKLSIFPNFGALNSAPVFEAFTQGAVKLGHEVVVHDMSADVYVIWSVLWHGRMQQNLEIWNFAKKQKKQVIVLEVGALKRGTTWRVGLGHINANGIFNNDKNLENGRSKKLGIFLKPWKKTGDHVLICGQHSKSEQWAQRPAPEVWLENLVSTIKNHTDRKIIFRPHPRDFQWCKNLKIPGIFVNFPKKLLGTVDDFDHETDFKNAWCVVNPSSNTGILAAINGIPVLCDPDSLAWEISMKIPEKIESPEYVDRAHWIEKVCHTEWTLEEIQAGIPIKRFL